MEATMSYDLEFIIRMLVGNISDTSCWSSP